MQVDSGRSTDPGLRRVSNRDFRDQLLDSMDIERERGITIKSNSITLITCRDGQDYLLNLIDTRGMSISRTKCGDPHGLRSALIVIDASQGSRRKRSPISIWPWTTT